jgi:membrane-bound serine protease (ClpP class)
VRRIGALLVVASALIAIGSVGANAAPASLVDVVKVEGAIDRTMNDYLRGTIADAEAAHSTLVLQIDTAGTLDVDPLALGDLIARASVPVIVWIGPTPAQAAGAGLLLVYASSLAAVAPGAATGPLQPVDLGHPDAYPTAEVRSYVARWQTMHGRSPTVTFPDHALTGAEAEDAHIIQTDAFTVPQLLTKVDGQPVQTANGRVTLDTAGSPGDQVLVRFHDLGPGKRVLHAVASPTWIYVLLVFGLAAIAFELTQPGFGFAGFSGVGMLALGVYGLTAVPAGARVAARRDRVDGCRRVGSPSRMAHVSRARDVPCRVAARVPEPRAGDRDLPVADRRLRRREPPLLRVRADGRDPVA